MTSDRRTGNQPEVLEPHRSRLASDQETGARQWWRVFGPGLVSGASDDDPSSIATYAQAGAKFGLQMLWMSMITLPLMAAVQETCDRTALATGRSLGTLARERFTGVKRTWVGVLLSALLVANVVNVAADLMAVGQGLQLLHAGPAWIWSLTAGALVTTMLTTGGFQRIEVVFKLLSLSLLAYVAVLFVVSAGWRQILFNAFVPHIQFSKDFLSLLVAAMGSTITPCLFFWQSAHRIEQMREENEGDPLPLRERTPPAAEGKQRRARTDVFVGMAFSQLVMFGIVVSTASTLGTNTGSDVTSAAQAAGALKPVAGPLASTLFALGFIGSGMLAIPVLVGSASVALSGLAGKPWGLSKEPGRAPFFYALLAFGTVGGTVLAVTGANPIRLLLLSATVNGVAAVPFLVLIMALSQDRRLMGEHRNGPLACFLGWTTVTLMAVASLLMLALLVVG